MSVFAKAKAKAGVAPAVKKSKETAWHVGSSADELEISRAISTLVSLAGERKAIETREKLAKDALKAFAERSWLRDFAAAGVQPEAPMRLVNEKGESVTFVVQDKTASAKVSDEMAEDLASLLGEDGAAAILFEQTTFNFDPVVMSQPANGGARLVQDVVGEALEEMIASLKAEGKISEAQADELISASSQRSFRPAILPQLAMICGRSVKQIGDFLGVVGSAIVRYVKT